MLLSQLSLMIELYNQQQQAAAAVAAVAAQQQQQQAQAQQQQQLSPVGLHAQHKQAQFLASPAHSSQPPSPASSPLSVAALQTHRLASDEQPLPDDQALAAITLLQLQNFNNHNHNHRQQRHSLGLGNGLARQQHLLSAGNHELHQQQQQAAQQQPYDLSLKSGSNSSSSSLNNSTGTTANSPSHFNNSLNHNNNSIKRSSPIKFMQDQQQQHHMTLETSVSPILQFAGDRLSGENNLNLNLNLNNTNKSASISKCSTPDNLEGNLAAENTSNNFKAQPFKIIRDEDNNYSCQYCSKKYQTMGALKMHVRTHTLPCQCKICNKCFSRPWLLQGHIRTHTGEKPFQCDQCDRAFADRSNLRAHLQTHAKVKKYSCRNCLKTFSRMSLQVKHEEHCREN